MSDQAPAGWYPQPDGSQRYWDGAGWTEHRAPAAPRVPAPYVVGPGGYQVAPKNPAIALLASFFIPGLGTMLNGETGKGVGILIGYLVSCVLILVLIGIPLVIGLWIWGMVDAYSGAQQWNARHGIVS